jgi:hypothetical protein
MPEIIGLSKSISDFDPRSVASCMLWLDSADASTLFSDSAGTIPATLSGTVGFWKDKSSRATSVSNATAGQRPTYTSTGLSYAGGQGLFGTPATASSGGLAAFVVFNPTTPSTRTSIVRWWSGSYLASLETTFNDYMIPSTYRYQGVSPVAGANNIMSLIAYSTTGIEYALNMLSGTNWLFTGSPGSSTELGIGSRGGLFLAFVGKINEVIVYDEFLTIPQRQAIEAYLGWKWSITRPTTHPFVTVRPFTRQFNPVDVPGCILWVDGDDPAGTGTRPASGSTVTSWVDKSGAGNNLTGAGSTTPSWTSGVFNGCGGIAMAGSANNSQGSYFQSTSTATAKVVGPTCTLFIMCYVSSTSTGASRLVATGYTGQTTADYADVKVFEVQWYPDTTGIQLYRNFNLVNTNPNNYANTLMLFSIVFDGTNMYFYKSGAPVGVGSASGLTGYTASTGNFGFDNIAIGRYLQGASSGNYSYNGYALEYIMYNTNLMNAQRQQVESYLAYKWGLTSTLPATHPFKTFSSSSVLPSSPLSITGCCLWLDSADSLATGGGSTLSTWLDKTGRGNTATSGSGTITVTSTGLTFDGTKYMTVPGITGVLANSSFVLFVVETLTGSGGYYFGDDNVNSGGAADSSLHVGYRSQGNHTFAFYSDDLEDYNVSGSGVRRIWTHWLPSGSNRVTRRNGAVDVTLGNSNRLTSFTAPRIGRVFGGNNYTGTIHEIVIYNTDIGLSSVLYIEGYLAWKWGLNNNLPTTHPFYKFLPAVSPNNIFRTATAYLPLKGGIADVSIIPQTVTNNGSVTFTTIAGRGCMYAPNSFSTYLSFPYTNYNVFTICFWLYPLNGSYYTAISITNNALNNPALQVDLTSATGTTIYTAMPNQWTNQPSGTTSGVNAWTHFAITVNQTTFVEQLYLNGALVTTATGTGTGFSGRSDIFVLGRSGDGGRAYYGYISQFAFFPYTLSAAQVITAYNTTA